MPRVNTRKKFLLDRRGARETREKIGKKTERKVAKVRGGGYVRNRGTKASPWIIVGRRAISPLTVMVAVSIGIVYGVVVTYLGSLTTISISTSNLRN
jgi:hypothetical protein